MLRVFSIAFSLVPLGILAGCANVPNVTVQYYFALTKVNIKVLRTVACDARNIPIVVTSTTPTILHVADPNGSQTISVTDLTGAFSDPDLKFEFYEDGRLKGVNATVAGQGEAILKSIVSIATAIVPFAAGGQPKPYPAECTFIKDAGGGKPLTLTYDGAIDFNMRMGERQAIPPDTSSGVYHERLKNALGGVCAYVTKGNSPRAPIEYAMQSGDILLKARQPGAAQITVKTGPRDGCESDIVWSGTLPVAQFGTDYLLPIRKAPIFGKQVFAAAFVESGALSSIQYSSTAGAPQALNVIGSALTALQPQTNAQKAADVKAEADLIAQQQRLVQCLADPQSCK